MENGGEGSGDAVTAAIRSNTNRRFERASRLHSDAGRTVTTTAVSAAARWRWQDMLT